MYSRQLVDRSRSSKQFVNGSRIVRQTFLKAWLPKKKFLTSSLDFSKHTLKRIVKYLKNSLIFLKKYNNNNNNNEVIRDAHSSQEKKNHGN